ERQPAGDPERAAIAGADGLAAPEWNLRSRSRFLQANIGQAPRATRPGCHQVARVLMVWRE
ncbi:MAG: hypothetical protein OEU99_17805, partial [Nitrospira sp.]|nr:hypothetical protein [Nitrospira sp.]